MGSYETVRQDLLRTKNIDLYANVMCSFAFQPQPGDQVMLKDDNTACIPMMLDYLRAKNIRGLILTGLWEMDPGRMDACVTTSAMNFVKRGFKTIIASEGTNYSNDSRLEVFNKRVRPEERVRTNAKYGIEIIPVRDIVALVEKHAATAIPAFA